MRDEKRPATQQWRHFRLLVCAFAALAACALLLLLPASPVRAQAAAGRVAVPRQQGAVTDLTGTLGADQVAALQEKIATLHDSAGPTLAVLLVPGTGQDSIEQFAIRVFDDWKPGTAKDDNGLLLLVALDDRHMRIEVGQGLEGQVPDLVANQIIEEHMKPRFRQKDYFGGIDAAVDALAARLGAAPALPAAEAPVGEVGSIPAPPQKQGWGLTTAGMLVLSLLGAGVVYGAYRWRGMRFFVAGAALLGVLLAAVFHFLGGEATLWGGLGLVGVAVGAVVLRFIVRNMVTIYQQSPRSFFVRLVIVLVVAGIMAFSFDGDWAPTGLATFFTLLFAFIPGTARRSGSGGNDFSASVFGGNPPSGYSGSDTSSSSSSDTGGSSSGGGSSGDW